MGTTSTTASQQPASTTALNLTTTYIATSNETFNGTSDTASTTTSNGNTTLNTNDVDEDAFNVDPDLTDAQLALAITLPILVVLCIFMAVGYWCFMKKRGNKESGHQTISAEEEEDNDDETRTENLTVTDLRLDDQSNHNTYKHQYPTA